MTTKKPAKCVTPKRDRDIYRLTARDIRHLTALVKEANDILSYYINMPENQTGDLATTRVDELSQLSEMVEDLQFTVDSVSWISCRGGWKSIRFYSPKRYREEYACPAVAGDAGG